MVYKNTNVKIGFMGHSVPYGIGTEITDALPNQGRRGYPEIVKTLVTTRACFDFNKYEFCNLAINGGTTKDVLDQYVAKPIDFDILFIDSGTNELPRSKQTKDFAIMSIEERTKVWNSLLAHAKKHATNIFVLELLPFVISEAKKKLSQCGLTISQKDLLQYNKTLKQMSETNGVEFLKRFNQFQNTMKQQDIMADAFHPNCEGHKLLADMIYYDCLNDGLLKRH